VTETLRDGHGDAVGGLVFNILFGVMSHVARKFQVIQKLDGRVVMKVVRTAEIGSPSPSSPRSTRSPRSTCRDAVQTSSTSNDIRCRRGKRKVVIVEKASRLARGMLAACGCRSSS